MGTQRLITEWVNFEYDPKIIKEQRQPGQPLIMKGILQKAEIDCNRFCWSSALRAPWYWPVALLQSQCLPDVL